MATLEELVVRLEADNAKLVSALEESAKVTARSSKQMEDAITKFSQESAKETSKFGNVMTVFAGTTLANLAVKGAQLAAAAFGVLKDSILDGIQESAEFEQAMVRLSNSMVANGNYTADAAKGLEDWIGSMETLSGIDDAVIAGNLAMLSSMTKLDAEGLKRAQESAINLSAALGIDLNSATKLVGKAAEGNTDAFKRYGITIQESADKNLTFANTLNVLESRFGGAAGGAMKTFQGAVLGLQNSFGNLFQAIGDVVVKNPVVLASLNEIAKIINSMTGDVQKNAGSWRKDFGAALVDAVTMLGVFTQAVNFAMVTVTRTFNITALGLQAIFDTLQAGVAVFAGGGLDDVTKAFEETTKKADEFNKKTEEGKGPLDNMVMALAQVANSASATSEAMTSSMEAVKPTIKGTQQAIEELTWAEEQRRAKSKEFAMSLAEDSLSVQGNYAMQTEAIKMAYEQGQGSFEEYKAAMLASQADMFAQEQQMLQTALETNQVTRSQYELARTQLEAQQGMARQKQEQEFNKQRMDGLKGTLGYISSLSSSSSKELAAIGKAAAITQATIDGYAAVQSAYKWGTSFGGPVLGAVFAAAAAAATAQNISRIAGVGLQSGIDSVPGVGSRDNFPAMLAPGERVVPSETNKDLTNFLENGGGNQPAPVFNLNFYGPVWGDKASAGADIVEAINEAVARGMSLRILGT